MFVKIEICLFKKIGKTQKLFRLIKVKLSISVLAWVSTKLAVVGGFWKNLSAALYLQLKSY